MAAAKARAQQLPANLLERLAPDGQRQEDPAAPIAGRDPEPIGTPIAKLRAQPVGTDCQLNDGAQAENIVITDG